MKVYHFLFLPCAFAVNFVLQTPTANSRWLLGSQLEIRWKLDNVTLPIDDQLFADIELHQRIGENNYLLLQGIAERVPSVGYFLWTVPVGVLNPSSTFKIKIDSSTPSNRNIPGFSDPFLFQDVIGSPDDAINIQQPGTAALFYPGNVIKIKWSKGVTLPYLPSGVNVELRSLNGPAIVTIARNVATDNGKDSEISWTVPADLVQDDSILTARLLIWGYDAKSDRLVYAEKSMLKFDFSDRNLRKLPLLVATVQPVVSLYCHSPSAGETLKQGSEYRMFFTLASKNDRTKVEGNGRTLSFQMWMVDDQNQKVATIFENYVIEKSWWTSGSITIPWTVPKITVGPKSQEGQRIFRTRHYRIVYEGRYNGKSEGVTIPFDGFSDLFGVIDGIPEAPKKSFATELGISSPALLSALGSVALYLM